MLLEAIIVPTSGPSVLTGYKGPSAAGWAIYVTVMEGEQDDFGVYVSASDVSNESEALVGALRDLLRSVAENIEIVVYVHQEWFVLSINEYLRGWQEGGWKRPKRHEGLWKDCLEIMDDKRVKVSAVFVPKGGHLHDQEFKWLREVIRIALRKHARNLGSPIGSFGEPGSR